MRFLEEIVLSLPMFGKKDTPAKIVKRLETYMNIFLYMLSDQIYSKNLEI